MFHLFGLTDSPSARQPGNDAPVGPNNGAINATKLQEKCKFKSDKIININCGHEYLRKIPIRGGAL